MIVVPAVKIEIAPQIADRGTIKEGYFADLVLIDGDPLRDISAIRKIAGVWCAGVPVADAPGLRPPSGLELESPS